MNLKSNSYKMKPLTESDIPEMLAFCQENTKYYQYMKSEPTAENLREDLTALPLGCTIEDKHFVGYYQGEKLIALLDLIENYPNPETAYIGWFIVNQELQGKGVGKQIVRELFASIKAGGFSFVELGCIKDNIEAKGFWKSHSFEPTGREVDTDAYTIVCMRKEL